LQPSYYDDESYFLPGLLANNEMAQRSLSALLNPYSEKSKRLTS